MLLSNLKNTRFASVKAALLIGSSLSMLTAPAAFAQNNLEAEPDEVVATGTRQTIQDSIVLKRDATTVVDGLSATEIGALPGLSIGDALETLTGVASQREGSGATTVSIRGLGPFLGSTVINGREATNGSGDRSVNFSQFPSELFNKLEVYKTQEASFVEGGVAGQIHLSTLKPLDYGKQRFQVQAKGSLGVDNLRLEDAARDFGHRITASYVDQFESSVGDFGISIGGQLRKNTNPEQEARSSSTFDACILSGLDSSSCDGSSPNAEGQDINPETGLRFGLTEDFVLTSSQRSFRQNITDDERNSIFGAVQWQPNDRVDINFDGQYAERNFEEFRSDLVVDANDFPGIDSGDDIIFPLTTAADGSLRTGSTTGSVEVNSQFSERLEEYIGFGGSISYDINESLNLLVDASYSDTSRRENQIQARVATGTELIGIEVLQDGSDAHQFTIRNLDVNDPNVFDNDNARVREDLNQFRNNTISAIKADLEYTPESSVFSAFKGGARYSVLEYDQLPRVRFEFEADNNDSNGDSEFLEFATEINGVATTPNNVGILAATACANSAFPESDFLNGEVPGNLVTNIDSDGNTIDAGTGRTFLTFNGLCLGETLLGRSLAVPTAADASGAELVQSVDIEEETIALYGQVDFDTEFNNLPVRGNFGVRYIDTQLTSNSFRTNLIATLDPVTGSVTGLTADNSDVQELVDQFSYSEFLPSFNVSVDVAEDVLLRGGVFRAISRPDPSDLGSGRFFTTQGASDDSEEDLSIADLIGGVVSTGNPQLAPFTSWNFDGAVEWYPNADSLLALGLYYKTFTGGFQNSLQEETFNINGETFTELVGVQTTTNETSTIFGFEASAAHAFSYLPGVLSGLGFKASYNYADSNFEFESGRLGEAVTLDENGNVLSTLDGFINPANLPGLSKHTASGQVYFNIGDLSLTGIGKYRSDFFQQFINTPQNLRFVDDSLVIDARASYKLSDNIKVSIEGTNIFNESRDQFNPTLDNFAEINVFGPRYFVGLRAKF